MVGPTDQIVRMSEITVLDCASAGDPTPEVVWLKGNTVISYDNRVRKARNGSLIIYRTEVSIRFTKTQLLRPSHTEAKC